MGIFKQVKLRGSIFQSEEELLKIFKQNDTKEHL